MDEQELARKYDEIAEKYLFSRTENKGLSGFHNREIEQPIMFSLVPENLEGKVLLDVGCGPGIHLREYIKRGAECYGIDISREFIRMAGERCPEAHVKVGSIFSLEFEDESVDIVTASLVYDHVDDMDRAFREVQRVLKSTGLFIFSVPHPTTYMFRDSEKDQFVPTRSYFDKQVLYHNIARSGKNFPAYPRILQEYFQFFLENGFVLRGFVESTPQDSWKEKYPDLDKNFHKLPSICFLKWEKP